MKKRIISGLLSLIFALFIPIAFISNISFAQPEKGLQLICEEGSTHVEGMHWKLYRIGERRNGELVLTGDFSKYPVIMTGLDENNIRETTQALESFIIGDSAELRKRVYAAA